MNKAVLFCGSLFRIKRNEKLYVMYRLDGKQHWESGFHSIEQAEIQKCEIEYKIALGQMTATRSITLEAYLKKFVNLYGEEHWTYSTMSTNTGLIRNYINPMLGKEKLIKIDTFR